MILHYHDVSPLAGTPWYLLELRSEKTIESTLKRIGKALHSIFRNDPVEIFIPVINRDLDVFELSTGSYIFVRSNNFQSLLRLKQITGVVSLVTEGDSNRPSKAISVDDEYVQTLIEKVKEDHRNRAVGIEIGSFVRILNGETRDFCGTVENLGDGRAVVRINLRTKSILLETPVRNLMNLSHVPENRRVYYYCNLVDDLIKDLPDGINLIEEDLQTEEPPVPEVVITPDVPLPAKRHSRQKTVTALVKKLILIEGKHHPMEISKLVVEALKNKEIKPPKNLFILYCILKDRLMTDYFKRIDPSIKTYREVIKKFGLDYKFSANKIAAIDPDLGIPLNTQEVCHDGRGKEAKKVVKSRKSGKKKLPTDKCGECRHERKQHKLTKEGTWSRCQKHPCKCKRFKKKPIT